MLYFSWILFLEQKLQVLINLLRRNYRQIKNINEKKELKDFLILWAIQDRRLLSFFTKRGLEYPAILKRRFVFFLRKIIVLAIILRTISRNRHLTLFFFKLIVYLRYLKIYSKRFNFLILIFNVMYFQLMRSRVMDLSRLLLINLERYEERYLLKLWLKICGATIDYNRKRIFYKFSKLRRAVWFKFVFLAYYIFNIINIIFFRNFFTHTPLDVYLPADRREHASGFSKFRFFPLALLDVTTFLIRPFRRYLNTFYLMKLNLRILNGMLIYYILGDIFLFIKRIYLFVFSVCGKFLLKVQKISEKFALTFLYIVFIDRFFWSLDRTHSFFFKSYLCINGFFFSPLNLFIGLFSNNFAFKLLHFLAKLLSNFCSIIFLIGVYIAIPYYFFALITYAYILVFIWYFLVVYSWILLRVLFYQKHCLSLFVADTEYVSRLSTSVFYTFLQNIKFKFAISHVLHNYFVVRFRNRCSVLTKDLCSKLPITSNSVEIFLSHHLKFANSRQLTFIYVNKYIVAKYKVILDTLGKSLTVSESLLLYRVFLNDFSVISLLYLQGNFSRSEFVELNCLLYRCFNLRKFSFIVEHRISFDLKKFNAHFFHLAESSPQRGLNLILEQFFGSISFDLWLVLFIYFIHFEFNHQLFWRLNPTLQGHSVKGETN